MFGCTYFVIIPDRRHFVAKISLIKPELNLFSLMRIILYFILLMDLNCLRTKRLKAWLLTQIIKYNWTTYFITVLDILCAICKFWEFTLCHYFTNLYFITMFYISILRMRWCIMILFSLLINLPTPFMLLTLISYWVMTLIIIVNDFYWFHYRIVIDFLPSALQGTWFHLWFFIFGVMRMTVKLNNNKIIDSSNEISGTHFLCGKSRFLKYMHLCSPPTLT